MLHQAAWRISPVREGSVAVLRRDLQPRHGCWPYTTVLSSTSQVVALLESPFPRGFAWFRGVFTRPGLAA